MSTPLIQGPEHFPVRASAREPLVNFIVAGLEDAGCRVLTRSSATQAPFLVTFETPDGERAGVLAYAFLANRTVTNGLPADERSFQIKYGPNNGRLHELWQDELGLITTILVGIDPDEGFFVAADPVLHNPTRFYIRLEFKDRDADAILAQGWHAWERAHRGRRDLEAEERAFNFEALVGGYARSCSRPN